ncbi:MAG: transposase, partial [Opitutus sp.]|nr:transposase [Opitutus sp.]
EEYVGRGAAVRVIDAFVDRLDLKTLGFLAGPTDLGRPGYHPAVLLKLYVYGYLNRLRSSRRLEAETHRNLEVISLLGSLRPDHWTITAFRREHHTRFKAVLREYNLVCRQLELFGAELVAIDGAKFKAVNSPKRHYTVEQLAEHIAHLDSRIDGYVAQLDQTDKATADVPGQPTAEELATKLARLQHRWTQQQDLHSTLTTSGQSEVSLTDPDSRGQKKVGVGYNVQIAVDAKHHLIAAESVEQAALTTYVPAPANCSGRTADGEAVYPKEKFTYDPLQNCYRCPAGQTLARGRSMGSRATTILTGRPARRGRSDRSARRRPTASSWAWPTKTWWSVRLLAWRRSLRSWRSARKSSNTSLAPCASGGTTSSCAAAWRWCGGVQSDGANLQPTPGAHRLRRRPSAGGAADGLKPVFAFARRPARAETRPGAHTCALQRVRVVPVASPKNLRPTSPLAPTRCSGKLFTQSISRRATRGKFCSPPRDRREGPVGDRLGRTASLVNLIAP